MWSSWWNENWQGKQKHCKKTGPMSLSPPSIPHDLTCDRAKVKYKKIVYVRPTQTRDRTTPRTVFNTMCLQEFRRSELRMENHVVL
jgi:hypothetical protein